MSGGLVGHAEVVMGTVVSFVVAPGAVPAGALEVALGEACAELHRIDAVYSTWKPDSPLSRLRRGEVALGALGDEVAAVLAACRGARAVSGGSFDPWALPGGVDPSGYVKGWAAGRARDRLVAAGVDGVLVNAGGDVATAGQPAPGARWRVGIRHPWRPEALACVVEVDGAVATSGSYERGAHLVDPRAGRPSLALASATVVGPDPGLADAYATALAVGGLDRTDWLPTAAGYGAYLIGNDGAEVVVGEVAIVDPATLDAREVPG